MVVPATTDAVGETVERVFAEFLEAFVPAASYAASLDPNPTSDADVHARPYLRQIMELKATERTTLLVDFAHFLQWNDRIATVVQDQFTRLEPFLRRAVQAVVQKYIPSYLYKAASTSFGAAPTSASQEDLDTSGPMRDFWVSFFNLPKVSRLRELRGEHVGKLDCISGTVTRTSEVRPELLWATFECGECGSVVSHVEQQFMYTEPIMCQNATCQNRVSWTPLLTQSKFCDWQKVRVQENPNEIPSGAMPRSMDVILRHEMVERAKAGDKVRFTGTVIVIPDISQLAAPGHTVQTQRSEKGRGMAGFTDQGVTGLKALGVRDMGYKLAFLASHAVPESQGKLSMAADMDETEVNDVVASFTPEEIDEMREMVGNPQIYNALVRSLAPQVFGHDEIKRGILLQLLGGVHKVTPEGIHLRGDLNICIVGDPSTAKSQFLKYVAELSPRSVFTSGKASSAAGLTAAVIKDEETGEFTIEAGALMLADNGICCIDEFDKMDVRDQVAIHEAMEQQTISIAKAGVQATLNARTSILAAANPIHGRYDKRLTLRQNIAMSAPIMSRFDLFFVVLDECDTATDVNVATHIINVHRFRDAHVTPEYTPERVAKYIRFARTFQPKMTPEAAHLLVLQYRELRQENNDHQQRSHRVTVRQLESMVRLAEALARVHCDELVSVRYVREAYRLLKKSILHIESEGGEIDLGEDEATMSVGDEFDEATVTTADQPPSAAPPKLALTPDEYNAITNMFLVRLRQVTSGLLEEPPAAASMDEDAASPDGDAMRRSELVQWYLEQVEDRIHTEADLHLEQRKADRVLRSLVKRGLVVQLKPVQFRQQQTASADADGVDDDEEDEDPFIVLNDATMPDIDM